MIRNFPSSIKQIFIFVLFITISAAAGTIASGAPGDLDPTFGPKGIITTSTGSILSDEIALGVAAQPDGKIVTVGLKSISSAPSDAVIVRYNPDGTLDPTFDGDGIVILNIGSTDEARAVAIQPDGKIVVAGWGFNTPATIGDIFIIRFNSNGSIDETFGTAGKTFIDFAGFNDTALCMVIQPDGKILAAGQAGESSRYSAGVARLNPDGTLDAGFGTGGKVITSVNQFEELLWSLALQPDGKIVGAGVSFSGSGDRFMTVRYNPNGSPDTSFDTDGIVLTEGLQVARNVLVQPDGKVVASGVTSVSSGNEEYAIARFNTDGSLDTSFDSDGKLTAGVGSFADVAQDAFLQPDGKLLVSGYSQAPGGLSFSMGRFMPNGSLDSTFNGTGFVTTIVDIQAMSHAMDILPSGKIILAGQSHNGTTGRDLTLARYEPNGALDISFGPPGRVTTNILNNWDSAKGVTLQPDGKIISVGSSRNNNNFLSFSITRHLPAGAPDTAFGSLGKSVISLNTQDDEANNVVVQLDGKIVMVGYSGQAPNSDIAVLRLNSNGTTDNDFGNQGKTILPIGTSTDIGYDIAIQPDGKLIVVGSAVVGSSTDFAVVRLTANGLLDGTFDGDGIVTTSLSAGTDRPRSVVIQPDGKILVAGDCTPAGTQTDLALARYNSNGSPDKDFGNDGKLIVSFGDPSLSETGNALALQSDGKFILAASVSNPTVDFAAARFNGNGTLDTTFDGDGFAVTPIAPNAADEAFDVVVQGNGKIVLAGVSTAPDTQTNISLVRYNRNGSLDSVFNGDGIVTTDYGNFGEAVYGAALQADGNIVVAGGINGYNRRDFGLWRYIGDSAVHRTPYDFDGDGKADVSLFRPSEGNWYLLQSTAGFLGFHFGASADKIAPADYDGDGKTDFGVFRPSEHTWYIQNSTTGFVAANFGIAEDIPQPGDFDGDGKAEIALWRPSEGNWYTMNLATGDTTGFHFGTSGDKPVVGDYDGDGKMDYAVYRPSEGNWYIQASTAGFIAFHFGVSEDMPVPADYDNDGKTDFGVFRPSEGNWYLMKSTEGFTAFHWGLSTDLPAPADYDGDGKADIAVFRNGEWYLQQSATGYTVVNFGLAGDKPAPNSFVY